MDDKKKSTGMTGEWDDKRKEHLDDKKKSTGMTGEWDDKRKEHLDDKKEHWNDNEGQCLGTGMTGIGHWDDREKALG